MSLLNIALIILGPFAAIGALLLLPVVASLLDRKEAEVMARVGELQVKAAEAAYIADLKERGQFHRVAKGAARAERRERVR